MLKSLFVQNYALISHLEIGLGPGLSIISGETGAGKSILTGALSLILGQRADTSVLNDKNQKCVVEGSFNISGYGLEGFFRENELDYEPLTTIRREVSHQGKSRAFVNDTPVGLPLLKDLGQRLVDIHSQHQNLMLGDNLFQLEVVDAFGGHFDMVQTYEKEFDVYTGLKTAFDVLKDKSGKASADLDYFRFQFDQLEQARLVPGEQEELEEEIKTLTHAEEIKTGLLKTHFLLSAGDLNALGMIKEAQLLMQNVSRVYPPAEELASRLESSFIELKDIAEESEKLGNTVESDPQRMEAVRERLDLIYALEQKHRAASVDELTGLRDELGRKIADIDSFDERLAEAQKMLEEQTAVLEKLAAELTEKRKKVIPVLEKEIVEILRQLAIPNARFRVELTGETDFQPRGKDRVGFLFSANIQGGLQDISRIASGGELSRVMLSLKSLLTRAASLPTVVFDEVDAGVSGEIADKVGNILQRMSEHLQLINITHLPQIASKGKQHYLVYKTDLKDRTETRIRLLDEKERVYEIARMLSGEEVTEAAFENARALLKN